MIGLALLTIGGAPGILEHHKGFKVALIVVGAAFAITSEILSQAANRKLENELRALERRAR